MISANTYGYAFGWTGVDRLNVGALQPDEAYQADMKAFWWKPGNDEYQAHMVLINRLIISISAGV